MKRTAALLLTLALSFGVLAACGGGGGDTVGGDLKAVELQFQMIGSPQPDIDRVSAAVSEYLKSIGKPYTVKLQIEDWGPYTDNVNLRLSTGEAFDICFTANWAASFYSNAAAGYFTELNPYLANYPQIEQTLTADFMNATQIDGKNYALPTNKEKARQLGWIFRKDIVDQMGMDLNAITSVEGSGPSSIEYWLRKAYQEYNLWTYPNFTPSDYQFDRIEEPIVMIRVEPGSKTILIADLEPEFKAAVRFWNKLYREGIIPDFINHDSNSDTEIASGRFFASQYQLKPGKDA
jgi:putative aldouronate transport system substrate-binding protein